MTRDSSEVKFDFLFPFVEQEIKGITDVKITPQWEYVEGFNKVIGVYHIAALVQFNEGPKGVHHISDSEIAIEHVDLQEDIGYFEYALPLEFSLAHVPDEVNIAVDNLEIAVNQGSSVSMKWQAMLDVTPPGDEQPILEAPKSVAKVHNAQPIQDVQEVANEIEAAQVTALADAAPETEQVQEVFDEKSSSNYNEFFFEDLKDNYNLLNIVRR